MHPGERLCLHAIKSDFIVSSKENEVCRRHSFGHVFFSAKIFFDYTFAFIIDCIEAYSAFELPVTVCLSISSTVQHVQRMGSHQDHCEDLCIFHVPNLHAVEILLYSGTAQQKTRIARLCSVTRLSFWLRP